MLLLRRGLLAMAALPAAAGAVRSTAEVASFAAASAAAVVPASVVAVAAVVAAPAVVAAASAVVLARRVGYELDVSGARERKLETMVADWERYGDVFLEEDGCLMLNTSGEWNA